MFARSNVLLLTAVWLGAWLTPAASGLVPVDEHNRLISQLEKRPMVFFVARGAANSCGPGCSEWIAAEGRFEPGTTTRFREFMEGLASRDKLPIFFHSRGGWGTDAVEIGFILRERRMTAGIGRTLTEQCRVFDQKDHVCQALIKSGKGVKARLLTNEGQCHSACVYAFLGASARQVPSGSFLGVHSGRIDEQSKKLEAQNSPKPRQVTISDINRTALRYLVDIGIDPRLQDLAAKTSAQRIYILSREEIARFGIETRGFYETPWVPYEESSRFVVAKSVTQHTATEPAEYLTTKFQLFCNLPSSPSYFGYRRELSQNSLRRESVLQFNAGGDSLQFKTQPGPGGKELAGAIIKFPPVQDILAKAVTLKDMTITETFLASESHPSESREIKLSTNGLSEALVEFKKHCVSRPVAAPSKVVGSTLPIGWPPAVGISSPPNILGALISKPKK